MKALSQADQDVLILMSEGCADHEICRRLQISQQTLNRSLKRIESRAIVESDDAGRYYERALRRRAEIKLQSLEDRFHALLDVMVAAVLVVDGRTGAIKEVNSRACELFGYQKMQLLEMTIEELVPPEYRAKHPAFRLGFLGSVRKREMGYHPPIFGLRSDGIQIEMAIALTATMADDDVMVICTEHSRWMGLRQDVERLVMSD